MLTPASAFLARDVIYTSRAYATISVYVCLWRTCIGALGNLGFKFRSPFTAHCGRSACGREGGDHLQEEWEGSSRSMLATARPSCSVWVVSLCCVEMQHRTSTHSNPMRCHCGTARHRIRNPHLAFWISCVKYCESWDEPWMAFVIVTGMVSVHTVFLPIASASFVAEAEVDWKSYKRRNICYIM